MNMSLLLLLLILFESTVHVNKHEENQWPRRGYNEKIYYTLNLWSSQECDICIFVDYLSHKLGSLYNM